ncbi:MAG: NUDIX pyrophosphatase [Thermoplasmata archaeon]
MSRTKRVVTVILKKNGRILILKRSNKVSSFQGFWSGVSGGINEGETPAEAAIRELREETGVKATESDLISTGETIVAEEGENRWEVHPFLLEVADESIVLDWEHDSYRWISPDELQDFRFVPRLDEVVESLLKTDRNGKTATNKST